jgi:hypothetical protein
MSDPVAAIIARTTNGTHNTERLCRPGTWRKAVMTGAVEINGSPPIVIVGMRPTIWRDPAPFGQLDHVNWRLVAPRSA